MYESMKNELDNKLSMAQVKSENEILKGQQIGNAISQLGNIVKQGMGAYAQSTINKDKYELKQLLASGQEQFLDVENENASADYSNWVNSKLDEYESNKGGIVKGYFSESRQAFIDDARSTFDTQLITRIDARNKLNALDIWDNAIKAKSNGEDLSVYEMPFIYKTAFDNDGMKVVKEKVNIGNPYDTNSEDLTDKERSFNQLLNVLYQSQCLVTDKDTAKAYINSKFSAIEGDLIKNDIISMASEWSSHGLDMGDGSVRHFTKDELISEIQSQYLEGFSKPYSGEIFTASESNTISDFVYNQVNNAYSKIYNTNKASIYTDADGFFEMQSKLGPVTSDVMFKYLQSRNMIELDADGTVTSHYGLDDNTWIDLNNIARGNDRILIADEWARNPRDINNDGIIDLSDVNSDVRYMILKDSQGNYYVNASNSYMSLDGTKRYAQSTVDAINRSGKSIESLSPEITHAVDSFVETGELPELDIKPFNKDALPDGESPSYRLNMAQSIWYTYLTNAGYSDEVARDIVNSNSNRIGLDVAVSDIAGKLNGLSHEDDEYTYFLSRNTVKVGDTNPVTGRKYTSADVSYINAKVKDVYTTKVSGDTADIAEDTRQKTAELAKTVENTQNMYISTLEQVSVIASNGYMIDTGYSRYGNGTASEILSISNQNISEILTSVHGVDIDNIVGVIDKEALEKSCNDRGLDYRFEYELECSNLLISALAEIEQTDFSHIQALYNSKAAEKFLGNLEIAYNSFEAETKASAYYDKSIDINPFSSIKRFAGDNINTSVAGADDFKPKTSITGWMDIVLDKVREGQSLEYLKNWVSTSPYISTEDTEKFLKMTNSDFFQKLVDNVDLTNSVKDAAKGISNPISSKIFWDEMFKAVSSMKKGDDVTLTVTKAMNAFSMAYGEKLALSMFEFEVGSSVYGTLDLGENKALSKDTKNIIDNYSNKYFEGYFDAAGIPYLIDDFMQKEGGIETLRAEIAAIAGEDVNNYCIAMALSALGEDIGKLDFDSPTFVDDIEKYFGRISKNSDDYDSRYADHVLRVAGSFKAVLGIFSNESISSIGKVVMADFGENMYLTDALKQNAIKAGTYISKASDGTPMLNIRDGKGNTSVLDLSFTTDDGIKDIRDRIVSELNGIAKISSAYANLSIYALDYENINNGNTTAVFNAINETLGAILLQCPSYQKYISDANIATQSMSIPNRSFKAWFSNGRINVDIIEQDIESESRRVTNTLAMQEEAKKQYKFNPEMALHPKYGNGEGTEKYIDFIRKMTGVVR